MDLLLRGFLIGATLTVTIGPDALMAICDPNETDFATNTRKGRNVVVFITLVTTYGIKQSIDSTGLTGQALTIHSERINQNTLIQIRTGLALLFVAVGLFSLGKVVWDVV
jgi:hypothetical protein